MGVADVAIDSLPQQLLCAAACRRCCRCWLCRWANKQRRNLAAGLLAPAKAELLQELRFEPDETEAEWLRWFLDLARWVCV